MKKRRIAYVNFWKNLSDPINGGTLRAYGLYDALARQQGAELLNVRGFHDETSMPDSWIVQNLEVQLNFFDRILLRISGFLAGTGIRLKTDALNLYGILKATKYLSGYTDVILTSADFLGVIPLLKAKNKGIRVIYDSHNVDYLLLPPKSKARSRTRRLESRLPSIVDEIWCCSEVDKSGFHKLNDKFEGKLKVVPNGAQIPSSSQAYSGGSICVGIIGAWNYEPNTKGLEWFLDNVEMGVPQGISIKICGIGSMPERLIFRISKIERVDFIGRVSHVSKFYKEISILAIPLLQGSGTRLKAIEAMSYGVPILSTSKGIEGIDLEHNVSCWRADTAKEWQDILSRVATDKSLSYEVGRNANRIFLEKYVWDEIVRAVFANDCLNAS